MDPHTPLKYQPWWRGSDMHLKFITLTAKFEIDLESNRAKFMGFTITLLGVQRKVYVSAALATSLYFYALPHTHIPVPENPELIIAPVLLPFHNIMYLDSCILLFFSDWPSFSLSAMAFKMFTVFTDLIGYFFSL